jgi:hypothetical protein
MTCESQVQYRVERQVPPGSESGIATHSLQRVAASDPYDRRPGSNS